MHKITFKSHGYTLAGHFFTATNPQPLAFLLIQGWTGHQNLEAAQALADLGFTSMTYDMRGHGDSEGNLAEFSRADFIADAIVAYDFLKQRVGDDAIGVVGSSFGSYTAMLLSEERPVTCLSLRVPATYPDEGFTEPELPRIQSPEVTQWRQLPLNYDNRAFKALHNFAGKVQIIEAERDEVIPHQAAQNYADAADQKNLEHAVMRGAPHRLENSNLRTEYLELLTKWAEQFKKLS